MKENITMIFLVLSLVDGDVFPIVQNVLVSRTDDAFSVKVQLLDAVGSPTHDSGHGGGGAAVQGLSLFRVDADCGRAQGH